MSYKTVPVLLGFDHNSVIGSLTIDTEKLPPYPNWHISLGYKANSILDQSNYELVSVGLVTDEKFKAYEPTGSSTV
jgi:hypothetical protein